MENITDESSNIIYDLIFNEPEKKFSQIDL